MDTVVCRLNIVLLVLWTLIRIKDAAYVVGGSVTEMLGGTCILPCRLIDNTETVSQISWQRRTRGRPQKENYFTVRPKDAEGAGTERFAFIGSFGDNNGSLLLTDVSLLDEGTYMCIFTRYPSGNVEAEILLNVLVSPLITIEDNHPLLGSGNVSLCTCTAANSKPQATVRWLTGTLADKLTETTNSIPHSNGTTTTVSSLFGFPTRDIQNHSVQCVVSSTALSKEETLSFTIQVNFPPTEVRVIERSRDTFECVTEANPSPEFTWRRPGQTWPQSGVKVDGATLQFLSVTFDLDGLYECEAKNTHGSKVGYLTVHTTPGSCSSCWVLFGLLLLLNIAAAVWYLYKSKTLQRIIFGNTSTRRQESGIQERQRVPTEPEREEEQEERSL